MDDFCICCGAYVPEGRQVCHTCENREMPKRQPQQEPISIVEKIVTLLVWGPIFIAVGLAAIIISPLAIIIKFLSKEGYRG